MPIGRKGRDHSHSDYKQVLKSEKAFLKDISEVNYNFIALPFVGSNSILIGYFDYLSLTIRQEKKNTNPTKSARIMRVLLYIGETLIQNLNTSATITFNLST